MNDMAHTCLTCTHWQRHKFTPAIKPNPDGSVNALYVQPRPLPYGLCTITRRMDHVLVPATDDPAHLLLPLVTTPQDYGCNRWEKA